MQRTRNKTEIATPLTFVAMAAGAWIWLNATSDYNLRLILSAVVFIGLAFGGATGINWLFVQLFARLADYRIAIIAPELEKTNRLTEMARAFAQLTPEQAEAMGKNRVELEIVPGNNTPPIRTLILPSARMPYKFVSEFAGQSDDEHLAPVGWWSEGSNKRAWAEAITRHMIEGGYATPASGPYPATWVAGKIRAGWGSIGYTEAEEEE
jgi:hypothetical protein